MISAAAVVVVRRALRMVFKRPRRPERPDRCWYGQPSTETSGGISRGLRRPRPTMPRIMPAPTSHSSIELPWSMNSPTPTRARPDPASTRPVGRHRAKDSATSVTASWRRALTGEIRLAATAGSRDATQVTPVPTTRHTTMVCHPTTNPAADVWAPWLVIVFRRIAATPGPGRARPPRPGSPGPPLPPARSGTAVGTRRPSASATGPVPCAVAPPGC